MKTKLPFFSLLLSLGITAQSNQASQYLNEDINNTRKDTVRTIAEVIINSERRLQVNPLQIPSLEAPMTINTIDKELLNQMNITRIEDVVQNVPGVHSVNQYGGFQFFNIRGFDNFVVLQDGLRDERHNITQSAPITNLANVERIEILKGPSGEMFGHSALGGIMNIVRKKPTAKFRGNASMTYGSYDTYNAVLGVGGPISNKLRYRFDAGITRSEGWRNVSENTNNFSGILQYLISERTSLELFLQYNKDSYGPDAGVPTDNAGNIVKGVNYKTNYANPFDYLRNTKKEIQLKLNHKFSNGSKLTNAITYYDDSIDYLMDEVLFYNPAQNTISLYNGPYHFNHITRPISNQLNYNFNFDTFGIKHQALAGNTISYLDRKTLYGDITVGNQSTDIPANTFLNLGERSVDIQRIRKVNELLVGTYFHDWIQFSEKWKALVGLRYDYFSGIYEPRRDINAPAVKERDEFNNFSYRFGLSFQPIENLLNAYASFSNFFKPSRAHNHRTNSKFLPERGFQGEAGIKMGKKDKYNISAAAFFIEKKNVIVGHNILSQVGGADSKGIELDADWTPVKGLYLKVGYAYTDAKFISKGNTDEDKEIVGNRTPWTPLHTFNTWVNYEFGKSLKGWGIGAGVYYADKTYQNQFNNQYLPAYTLVNGTVYYQTKQNIRIGLNVENIFNQLYFRSALSNNDLYSNDVAHEPFQSLMQAYPGRGRNFRITLGYQF
ncbi:MAG: TonB-dependent receptor [Cruoricaptor ignavus]|nr:TonB-dependent receptor [Cruoricaptor ignavus]